MFPKGTIYQSGKSDLSGEVRLVLSRATRFAYTLVRGVGAGLVAFATLVALFTYGPIIKEELSYDIRSLNQQKSTEDFVDVAKAENVVAVQREAESLGINSYFSLSIPKIDASSNIVANVDAGKEEEYLAALKEGIAHARGTFFPGQGNNIFLFAHSTDSPLNIARYNAIFYLLRKLEPGDDITVFFADEKYRYQVEQVLVTSPEDISWLTKDYGDEALILQTCDPPGTTWKRLLVIAKPIS